MSRFAALAFSCSVRPRFGRSRPASPGDVMVWKFYTDCSGAGTPPHRDRRRDGGSEGADVEPAAELSQPLPVGGHEDPQLAGLGPQLAPMPLHVQLDLVFRHDEAD